MEFIKRKTPILMKYIPDKIEENGPVDQIYKYIKEIKDFQHKKLKNSSNLMLDEQKLVSKNIRSHSMMQGGLTNASYAFKSKAKKYEMAPDKGIPGPGTYTYDKKYFAEDTKGPVKFGTTKKCLNLMNYNNHLLIKAVEPILPAVGQYFQRNIRRNITPKIPKNICIFK